MKTDLAGGRLPPGPFGVNAAWWAHVVLAFILHRALTTLGLGPAWVGKRMKAVRLALHGVPGRAVRHARRLTIQLSTEPPHPTGCCSPPEATSCAPAPAPT